MSFDRIQTKLEACQELDWDTHVHSEQWRHSYSVQLPLHQRSNYSPKTNEQQKVCKYMNSAYFQQSTLNKSFSFNVHIFKLMKS